MTVAFAQNIGTWGNNSTGPQTSGTFTPTAGDFIFVPMFDGVASGKTLVYSGSVNTPVAKLTLNDSTNGNTFGIAAIVSALAGASQTLTVNSSPSGDQVTGWAIEYSGVTSSTYTSNGPIINTTAPTGIAVAVPTGAVLVALCYQSHGVGGTLTGQTSGSVAPTDRQTGFVGGASRYTISEWVGTGSTVTPTWSASVGAGNYVVLQVLLSALAFVPVAPMSLGAMNVQVCQ